LRDGSSWGLILSGVNTAYRSLGFNLDHLLYSAYGRTIIAKVSVFGVLIALGGYDMAETYQWADSRLRTQAPQL
jgi:hypothetical protein